MKKLLFTATIFTLGCPKKEVPDLEVNTYESMDLDLDDEDLEDLPEAGEDENEESRRK